MFQKINNRITHIAQFDLLVNGGNLLLERRPHRLGHVHARARGALLARVLPRGTDCA